MRRLAMPCTMMRSRRFTSGSTGTSLKRAVVPFPQEHGTATSNYMTQDIAGCRPRGEGEEPQGRKKSAGRRQRRRGWRCGRAGSASELCCSNRAKATRQQDCEIVATHTSQAMDTQHMRTADLAPVCASKHQKCSRAEASAASHMMR